jgi:hypothetical protein
MTNNEKEPESSPTGEPDNRNLVPPAAFHGSAWEYEYVANLLFGAEPRSVYVEYEPGNATCYRLLIVPTTVICEVGRTHKYFSEGQCVVTWIGNSKSYTFTLGYIDASYLADKLDISNITDAQTITDFLNRVAGDVSP